MLRSFPMQQCSDWLTQIDFYHSYFPLKHLLCSLSVILSCAESLHLSFYLSFIEAYFYMTLNDKFFSCKHQLQLNLVGKVFFIVTLRLCQLVVCNYIGAIDKLPISILLAIGKPSVLLAKIPRLLRSIS